MANRKKYFVQIHHKETRNGTIEVMPKFCLSSDSRLLIKGGDILAFYDEDSGLWVKGDEGVVEYVDSLMDAYVDEHFKNETRPVIVKYMWDCDSGSIDKWHNYCKNQCRNNYDAEKTALDEKIIFSNQETCLEDYATHKLPYPLTPCDISAYDQLMTTWYGPIGSEQRQKIEWAIGAIITGASKYIQKFLVIYGDKGTGKSSFFRMLQTMFDGYVATFDAAELASKSSSFALEPFAKGPLVAIQDDGDLSKIEDNTKLNSIVSHEFVLMNTKFERKYPMRIKAMLFMGTNNPVHITDAKSGILRRLIDVYPTGDTVPFTEYTKLMHQVEFELGGIAWHCKNVFENLGDDYYHSYIPTEMIAQTNDFYNFVEYFYEDFVKRDQITAVDAYSMYNQYAEFANIGSRKKSYNAFKQELKNYFRVFEADTHDSTGAHVRSLYSGFITDKFKSKHKVIEQETPVDDWLSFKEQHSILDDIFSECLAQYHNEEADRPMYKWENVKTRLKDLDTHKLHWVSMPEKYLFIDFDLRNEKGEKDVERNIEAARQWPRTYGELSKSGGLHLIYLYPGDASELSMIYGPHIEIKTYLTTKAMRRKLTKCNNVPVATITSGLPKKEGGKTKVIDDIFFKNNDRLKKRIIEEMLTKPVSHTNSVSLIKKWLDEAYEREDFDYDVLDLKQDLYEFASKSTNGKEKCIAMVANMHFQSKKIEQDAMSNSAPFSGQAIDKDQRLVFFDIESYPNLLLLVWKYEFVEGPDDCNVLINPSPERVRAFFDNLSVIGYNNKVYDNQVLMARVYGYSVKGCQEFSARIIANDRNARITGAKEASYSDVLDFASSQHKQSLKKYEIELDLPHMEMDIPWDEPVPDDKMDAVIEYCKNDVRATEAVFHHLSGDWKARLALAKLSGLTPNDSTNEHTTRFMFGLDRNPQIYFNYPNLADEFPGYSFINGKSSYRGEDPGEGGYVYAEPGIYHNVALLDIASMHPSSIIAMNLFGKYTQRFADIVKARILIKHKQFDEARKMMDGQLAPFLDDPAEAKNLAGALKTAINSVYGLTKTSYKNPFRDPRNVDNVVAKRGALFMINLKHEVQARGFKVAHIKTDSIKIPDATPEIISFVQEYGKQFGYNFEHEATYDRMCLVNDAVYIAKYATADWCTNKYGYIPEDNAECGGEWTATGKEFKVPFIFKTLFSKEPLTLKDMSDIKSVSSSLYLDFNETLPDVSQWELLRDIRFKMANGLPIRKKDQMLLNDFSNVTEDELNSLISEGHNYSFVGRVGQFTPVKPGSGGGLLMRKTDDGYSSAGGAKGYRWIETEKLKRRENPESYVDISYFRKLCDDAIAHISEFGNFEDFMSGVKPLPDFMNIPDGYEEEIPFDDSYIVK